MRSPTSHSVRLKVHVPLGLRTRIQAFAKSMGEGTSLTAAIRVLLAEGLKALGESGELSPPRERS